MKGSTPPVPDVSRNARHRVDLYVMSPDGRKHGYASATVEAEYQPAWRETRDDPGEPEGYEIDSCEVAVNIDVKLCVEDGAVVFQVPGYKRVEVEVTEEELEAGVVRVMDCDLHDDIGRYLLGV